MPVYNSEGLKSEAIIQIQPLGTCCFLELQTNLKPHTQVKPSSPQCLYRLLPSLVSVSVCVVSRIRACEILLATLYAVKFLILGLKHAMLFPEFSHPNVCFSGIFFSYALTIVVFM